MFSDCKFSMRGEFPVFPSALDPALSDPELNRKLRSNRDMALNSLEEMITKYANKQEDIEVEETRKRQERDRQKKEVKEQNIFLYIVCFVQ